VLYPWEGERRTELLGLVTRRGGVTIPAEVRKALSLKRGDLVVFSLPDANTGAATVRRAPATRESVIARTAGMLKGPMPALDPQAERASAEQAFADEAVERTGAS